MDDEVLTRARAIKLVAMDVDGVLTDGRIILGNSEELKAFHVHDGLGIALAHRAGLITAIITGRCSQAVERRGKELSIPEIHQGAADKVRCLEQLLVKYQLTPQMVAYIGDDLNDVPLFLRVGLAVAVADASPEARRFAHYVTRARGGRGAVREVITMILKAQERWDELVAGYLGQGEKPLLGQ